MPTGENNNNTPQPNEVDKTIKRLKKMRGYYKNQLATAKTVMKHFQCVKGIAGVMEQGNNLYEYGTLTRKATEQEVQSQKKIDDINTALAGLGNSALVQNLGHVALAFDITTDVYSGNLNIPPVAQDWIKKFAKGKKYTFFKNRHEYALIPTPNPFVSWGVSLGYKVEASFIAEAGPRKLDASGLFSARIDGGFRYEVGLQLFKPVEYLLFLLGCNKKFFTVDVDLLGSFNGKATLGQFSLNYLPAVEKNIAAIQRIEGNFNPFSIDVFLQPLMSISPNEQFIKAYNTLIKKYEKLRESLTIYPLPKLDELKGKEVPLSGKIQVFSIEVPRYQINYTLGGGYGFTQSGQYAFNRAPIYDKIAEWVQIAYQGFLNKLLSIALQTAHYWGPLLEGAEAVAGSVVGQAVAQVGYGALDDIRNAIQVGNAVANSAIQVGNAVANSAIQVGNAAANTAVGQAVIKVAREKGNAAIEKLKSDINDTVWCAQFIAENVGKPIMNHIVVPITSKTVNGVMDALEYRPNILSGTLIALANFDSNSNNPLVLNLPQYTQIPVDYNPEQYTVNFNELETPIFANIEGFDFNSQTEHTTKTADTNVDEIQPVEIVEPNVDKIEIELEDSDVSSFQDNAEDGDEDEDQESIIDTIPPTDEDEDEDDEDEFFDAEEYVPPTDEDEDDEDEDEFFDAEEYVPPTE